MGPWSGVGSSSSLPFACSDAATTPSSSASGPGPLDPRRRCRLVSVARSPRVISAVRPLWQIICRFQEASFFRHTAPFACQRPSDRLSSARPASPEAVQVGWGAEACGPQARGPRPARRASHRPARSSGPRHPARPRGPPELAARYPVSGHRGSSGRHRRPARLPGDPLLRAVQPPSFHRGGGGRGRAHPRGTGALHPDRPRPESRAEAARPGVRGPLSRPRAPYSARGSQCPLLRPAELPQARGR